MLWPSRKQWKVWSLPSQLTAIGTLIGALSLGLYLLERTGAVNEITTGKGRDDQIYRIRVLVLDVAQRTVEDAKLTSSLGGEPKKVAGGWEFDIPALTVPSDRRLSIYATREEDFLRGRADLRLGKELNSTITLNLFHDTTANVRGIIIDGSGRALSGIHVSVVGYPAEAAITGTNGAFVLTAHAAPNQQVQLHAEGKNYSPVNQFHPAGDWPATIQLERK